MKLLSNVDELVQIQDRDYRDVEVKEWNMTVRLAVMTGADRDSWELSMLKADGKVDFQGFNRAGLVGRCIVNEQFERIFTTPDQIKALAKKSAVVIDRLFDICQELNGITDDDLDELEKNSETVLNEDSGLS